MKMIRKSISAALITAIALLVSATPPIGVRASELDNAFGIGGKVVTAVTPGTDFVRRVRIQPDGKIVTLGRNAMHSGSSFVVRHNANGTLDTSFGTNGVVRHEDSLQAGHSSYYELNDFVIQSNGDLVFTGTGLNPLAEPSPVIFRLNSQGFGGFDQYQGLDYCSGKRMAVQPDGKLIVLGLCGLHLSDGVLVAIRYGADGSADLGYGESLGSTGILARVFSHTEAWADGAAIMDFIGDAIVQPDGKVVLSAGGNDTVLARLNSNGSVDNSFSGDGIARVANPGGFSHPTGIALQSDGKIVVSGVNAEFGLYNTFILRFNPDGTPDNVFGANGRVIIAETDSNSRGIASALAIQPDGKILTAGTRNGVFATARFTTNGAIDSTFGTNGILTTPVGSNPGSDTILSLAFQPDGKLIAAGSVRDSAGLYDVALVRFQAFKSYAAISGRVLTPNGSGLRNASVTLTDPQGRVRTVTTSSFGSYAFDNVGTGSLYTIAVSSRRYRFGTRSMEVNTDLANVDFVGLE